MIAHYKKLKPIKASIKEADDYFASLSKEHQSFLKGSESEMTVKELIENLKDLPTDMPVIMSKDGGGNGYSPLSALDQAWYVAESTWSGEVYSDDDLEELRSDGMGSNAEKVVCFWPTN